MRLNQRYIKLLLVIIVLGAYYMVIFSPYCLMDDMMLVIMFPEVDKFNLLDRLLPKNIGYYRPLLDLTYFYDDLLWMFHESFMHLENALFHLVNTLFVYTLAQELLRRKGSEDRDAAFIAAAIFALHPINTESVNWISGRPDPLAGVFILGSLILLLRGLEAKRLRDCITSAVAFSLACLAKETALFVYPVYLYIIYLDHLKIVTSEATSRPSHPSSDHSLRTFRLIAISCAGWFGQLSRSVKSKVAWYLIYTTVPVCYFLMRRLASSTVDRGMDKFVKFTTTSTVESLWGDKAFIALKAMGFYMKKIFIPWPLNFNIVSVSDAYIILGLALIPLIFWLLWRRDLTSALFLCSICLASAALFVAVGQLAWTPFAERYLYLPSAPFSIGIVFVMQDFRKRYSIDKAVAGMTLLLLFVFAATTIHRNLVWVDDLKLYEDSYNMAPTYNRAIKNYAAALARAGRYEEANKIRSPLKITESSSTH